MKRYFIYSAYNGKNYCGWQTQPNAPAVQQTLEEALSLCFRQATAVVGAGRTDAGVHARAMPAHFDREEAIDNPLQLTDKLNGLLPKDIAVGKIVEVRPDAHARFDALWRTYRYDVTTKKDPFHGELACRLRSSLDFGAMNACGEALTDYTDFTSFAKLHTDVKTHRCRIACAGWREDGDRWIFTIQADRFLRNMVRAIVGTMFDVGRGKLTVDGFRAVIEAKDRGRAGTSAPAHGLFLDRVEYPEDVFII